MQVSRDATARGAESERSRPAAPRARRHRRSPPPPTDSTNLAAEIARLSKRRADLLIGFENLTDMHRRGVDTSRRQLEQGAKLRSVDRKIFGLRQLIFLFGDH
jgi:hypothetical protein